MVGMCEPMGLARSAHARNWDGGSKPTTSRGNEQPIEVTPHTLTRQPKPIANLPQGLWVFTVQAKTLNSEVQATRQSWRIGHLEFII